MHREVPLSGGGQDFGAGALRFHRLARWRLFALRADSRGGDGTTSDLVGRELRITNDKQGL